jgi:hypothetical protein
MKLRNYFKKDRALKSNVLKSTYAPFEMFTNHSTYGYCWHKLSERHFNIINLPYKIKNVKDKEFDQTVWESINIACRELGWVSDQNKMRNPTIINLGTLVQNVEAIFVVSKFIEVGETLEYTKKAKRKQVFGYEGIAVQFAINSNKKVYVYDQTIKSWFTYLDKDWQRIGTPTLTPNFASFETYFNESCKKAINDIYIASIQNPTKTPHINTDPLYTESYLEGIGLIKNYLAKNNNKDKLSDLLALLNETNEYQYQITSLLIRYYCHYYIPNKTFATIIFDLLIEYINDNEAFFKYENMCFFHYDEEEDIYSNVALIYLFQLNDKDYNNYLPYYLPDINSEEYVSNAFKIISDTNLHKNLTSMFLKYTIKIIKNREYFEEYKNKNINFKKV